MSHLFFAILLTVSAMVFLMLQRSRNTARTHMVIRNVKDAPCPSEQTHIDSQTKFRGFIIEPGVDCCQASLELRKVTFSNKDRVSLPLASCDKKICTCQRTEIKDRRKYHRRSKLDRRNQIRFDLNNDDRRRVKGRREQDKLWSGGYIY